MGLFLTGSLTAALERLGFESGRLKTGTPPRVDGRTLDYSVMEEQPSDEDARPFSYLTDRLPEERRSCWLTYTTPEVHEILRSGFDRSPMFTGRIQGRGPRYCPSIEDKIDRFASKDRHQLFIEPEGLHTYEVYVNGFSTSLPEDIQVAALRKVPGLEQYVEGLYFAGQINGTTGYEEAAAQGLMAGINAVLKLRGEEQIVLKRSQAYIGVLIDDLVAKGTDEPYRMFTSRAEYRLLLRQDNADLRLTELGYRIGLASRERYERMLRKREAITYAIQRLKEISVRPEEVNGYLEHLGTSPVRQTDKLIRLVLRPEVRLEPLLEYLGGEKISGGFT